MKKSKLIAICGASGLLAGAALSLAIPAAHALYYGALPASMCMAEWYDLQHSYQNQSPQAYLQVTTGQSFVCPIIDNTSLQHQNLNAIKVRVNKASAINNPGASVCAWLPSTGSGGACGLVTYGNGTLNLDLVALNLSTETAYVWLYMPSNSWAYDLYFEDT